MEHREFKKVTKRLVENLTQAQARKLVDALQGRGNGEAVHKLINRRLIDDLKCPHCAARRVHRHGNADGLQRYKCLNCKRTFNALTGTALSRLRRKNRWLTFQDSLNRSHSVRRAAKLSGIDKNTSFRWRHRFLKSRNKSSDQCLTAIVEVDECFILESFKGKCNLSRKARKRGGKGAKKGLSSEQVPILIARDRLGNHFDAVLPDRSENSVRVALEPVISKKDTLLCTDGDKAIIAFAEKQGLEYELIIASHGEHVHENVLHIQNVNSYISRFKKWLKLFNGVATRYLPSYLGWRRMLDRAGDKLTPKECLAQAIG